jgi:ABC-type multidrug transport system ATPase subunit
VLFLDEPTTGVDAVSRKEFWDMLKQLRAQGITILVSTPYMDEADLCDRIALVLDGKILSIDTPPNIVKAYPGELYGVRADASHKLLQEIRHYPDILSCYAFGEYLHVTFRSAGPANRDPAQPDPQNTAATSSIPDAPAALTIYLQQKGYKDIEIKKITPGIEDSFIRLLSDTGQLPKNPSS